MAGRISYRRVGCQEVAWKPGVRIVGFAGNTLAVRTNIEVALFAGQQFRHGTASQHLGLPPSEMRHALIQSQNSTMAIVDENGIADGIKGVSPLALHGVQPL